MTLIPYSTTDALDCTAVTVEGNEDNTIRPVKVSAVHKKYPPPSLTGPVTPEDLVGIVVTVEGNEDYTVRPRQRKRAVSEETN